MKTFSTLFISLTLLCAACKSHKEASSSAAAAPAPTAPAVLTTDDLVKAAKTQWPDVTAQTIDEGKALYTTGACTRCHGPEKIEPISEQDWPSIINRMAKKARITDVQKDAVLKYALAVKIARK